MIPLSWTDAAQACQSLHKYSHLVVIDNDVEQQAIVTDQGDCVFDLHFAFMLAFYCTLVIFVHFPFWYQYRHRHQKI